MNFVKSSRVNDQNHIAKPHEPIRIDNQKGDGWMEKDAINKWVLLLLVLLISSVFLMMIRQFLMAILLSGIFSALFHPVYRRFVKWFGGRRVPASLITILIILTVVLAPLVILFGIIVAQAVKVAEFAKPWVKQHLIEPGAIGSTLQSLPFYDAIEPYRNDIITRLGELVGSMSGFIVDKLSSATFGTVHLFFTAFVMLYCMFFFLMDGNKLIHKILYYLPLESKEEESMLSKFTSVTRATLKGSLVIGVLQGGLAGAAFAVVGIPSAVFWGAIMAVLSIIPSIGAAIVWAPAAIILMSTGSLAKGLGLASFCAVVVGSVDNLLRPVLVGKDTELHELMIFFGTLGGIFMFGVAGMIIGPIIAALFVAVWEIYGTAFKDILPEVRFSSQKVENTEE
jgi:predicted PurR-regulated permease PerM